MEQKY